MEEYLTDCNATQAAVRAGYSRKTARSQGQRLLTNVDVKSAIDEAIAKRRERAEITQDQILSALWEIARQEASDLPRSSLKVANKLRALELLGRHMGLFDESPSVQVNVASVRADTDFSRLSNEQIRTLIEEADREAAEP